MNWGNKLLVTFVVFGLGISYLVYRCAHVNYELVENDYYKQELRYQQVIDNTKSANSLKTSVSLNQSAAGVTLRLPEEMRQKKISGNVWFYCAYNANKDRKFELKTDAAGEQVFPLKSIEPGNYTAKINWTEAGHNYYTEKNLTVL